jgi:hypothetical protein
MNQENYPIIFHENLRSLGPFYLASLIIILFIFSSCSVNDLVTGPDNEQNKIEGSGEFITEEIEVPYFHSISVSTAGLVSIRQGTEQNVIVTVDDNIIDYLIVRVQDDELIIEVINNVQLSNYELAIDVNMTDLESLVTNSAGSIRGLNTFEEDRVNLMVNSAGSIFLNLIVDQLNSMSNSAGNLFLSGQANKHNAMLSSAGNLSAFELATDTTTIILNSAGNAEVFASELLDVTINSVGSVFYKGAPVIIQHLNSIGRVYSAN